MNRNFMKLDDFIIFKDSDQKEIFSSIASIEKRIDEDDLEVVGTLIRKVVEKIFVSTPEINTDGSIIRKIDNLIKNLPFNLATMVRDGLFSLGNMTNRESHATGSYKKSDAIYNVKLNAEEARLAIRSIWLFIKWIGIEVKEIDELKSIKYEDAGTKFIREKIDDEIENINKDMIPESLTIVQLIFSEGYQFNIPTYQRDYTWNKKNVSKLIEDLLERSKDNKNHYFGALAIGVEKNNENVLRIIDGQQRITTSLILIKSFYDEYIKRKMAVPVELQKFIDKKIKSIYISKDVLSSQRSVRFLLKGGLSSINGDSSVPFDNYNQFVDCFENLNNDEFERVYTTFVTKFEVTTLIFTTTLDNEMDIFENLNTGGTKLSDWELIRSYIFSRIDIEEFRINETAYDSLLTKKIVSPISNEANGKSFATPISNFFKIYNRYMFSIKNKEFATSDIYADFKKIWWSNKSEKFRSLHQFQTELDKIEKILNCYMELVYWYKGNNSPLHGYAHIVNLINAKEFATVLIDEMLSSCKFDDNNKLKWISNEFIKVMRVLESYIMRAPLYGNPQANNMDTFLRDFSGQASSKLFRWLKEKSAQKMMGMDDFSDYIQTKTDWTRAQIMNMLTHIELNLRGIQPGKSGMVRLENTHEHIIAQQLKYKDYDDKNISREDFLTKRDSKKDSLGNALILTQGDNSKAGNKAFSLKKPIYKGSSKLAHGVNGKVMNLLEKEVFTFDDITRRAKELGQFIVDNGFYFDE